MWTSFEIFLENLNNNQHLNNNQQTYINKGGQQASPFFKLNLKEYLQKIGPKAYL